jgi:hypothetical protein
MAVAFCLNHWGLLYDRLVYGMLPAAGVEGIVTDLVDNRPQPVPQY